MRGMVLCKLGVKKEEVSKVGAETPPRQKNSGGVFIVDFGALQQVLEQGALTYQRGKNMLQAPTPSKPRSVNSILCILQLGLPVEP